MPDIKTPYGNYVVSLRKQIADQQLVISELTRALSWLVDASCFTTAEGWNDALTYAQNVLKDLKDEGQADNE